jgi:putative MFS transporter
MVPIDAALVAEFAPARIRGRVSAALPLCWPIGIFAAAGVSLLVVPTIGWRWLFAIGIVPAVLVFFIRRGVPESPRWLAARGRTRDARASLAYVGIDAAALDRAMERTAARPVAALEKPSGLRDLFAPAYARRVVQTWTMWFCSNFAASAFSVWLPTIYATIYHIQLTRTLFFTFIIAGTSVVGRIVAYALIDRVGRKPLIVTGYTVAAFAALQFTLASTETSLLLCAMFYGFFADIGSLAMTVYTPEVYPLRIRGLAASAAMGIGRFGGMVSPFVIGLFIAPDTVVYVWVLMAACQLVSGLLSLWLARETKGRNLEAVSEQAAT